MKSDGHAKFLCFGINRVELGLTEVDPAENVRGHHHGDSAKLSDRAPDFFHGRKSTCGAMTAAYFTRLPVLLQKSAARLLYALASSAARSSSRTNPMDNALFG